MKSNEWDVLCYEGRQLPLGEALLEPYFQKHPALRPPGSGRSYWASYALEDGELRVHDVEVADARNLRTGRRSVLAGVFESPEDRIVRWHSGLLLLPFDKQFLLLEIRRGRHTGTRLYDAASLAAFKKEQFDYFCLTDDYEALEAATQKEFELQEQEARRKDAGRGYRAFDAGAFRQKLLQDILLHSRELLAD
ncbi:hypothetical protein [Flaviaesturariibacter terrae]